MNNRIYEPVNAAISYMEKGYCPIPVEAKSKKPINKEWQKLKISQEEAPEYFSNNSNIGIVLGTASGNLVDVDLDHPDAVLFASHFFPETNSVFGRPSNPSSHKLYKVDNPQSTKQFKTDRHGMIVELRSNGAQTVFPGSIHESGEFISFERDEEPADVTWDDLSYSVRNVALSTVLYGVWKKGNRHTLALSAAGFLAVHGVSIDDAMHIIETIAIVSGDEELDDRLEAVRTTYAAHEKGTSISWKNDLESILGKETSYSIQKWMPCVSKIAESNGVYPSVSEFSDAGLSDVFAKENVNNLIWSGSDKCWYEKQRQIYQRVDPVIVQGKGKRFLQNYSRTRGYTSRDILSKSRIDAVVALSRNHLWRDAATFDTDPELLGLSNGSILNIRTGGNEYDPESIVTNRSGVTFDYSAKCPNFEKFLNRIFNNDQEIISFLQRAIGYSLTGHVSEQVAFILVGKGANGKSTLLNILQIVFGEYATTTPMQTLMDKGNPSHQTNDLAALKGRRFVVASEGERDQKLAENKIKLMTGGDTIKARFMYGDYFEYIPKFKLWMGINNLPNVTASDDAIWRRLCIIEFPVQIPKDEQDPNLLKNLRDELSGIFNWALEGYQEWSKNGLQTPEKVMRFTNSFREENDEIGQWISCCCTTSNKSASTPVKDLHASYQLWAIQSGKEPMVISSFGKELSRKGFGEKRYNKGNKRIGISLIEDDDGEGSYQNLVDSFMKDVGVKSTQSFNS
jgi:putative DNA primase/helicase